MQVKPNYKAMTRQELLNYLAKHPKDLEAFTEIHSRPPTPEDIAMAEAFNQWREQHELDCYGLS
jgi:hypothetical protein